MQPFHLAIPVTDLDSTRKFYVEVLGCTEGRSAATWIDFDLMGHQISAHLRSVPAAPENVQLVDGDEVPVPHFGVVLPWEEWHQLADRLQAAEVKFVLGPTVRFRGQVGEQATMFFRDPSGNALEFKSVRDPAQLFEVAPRAS